MSDRGRAVTPVAILAERLDALALASAGDGVDPALRRGILEARELATGLDRYVESCTTPESADLAELGRVTRGADWEAGPGRLEKEMLSGHVEGRLLAFLVRLSGARAVLEVGMFTGYSALAMAEALPDDGRVVACELDPHAADIARTAFDRSPHGAKIEIRLGDADDQLHSLARAGERFDLVFVDADKVGYARYLAQLLDSDLLAPGALVCVDNTLMQGLPWTSGPQTEASVAIAAFNRAVADDPRVEQVLVPVRDGLTLIRRV